MLMARKASRLKLIWPRSSLKNHQNVQETPFLQKAPGVNGLIATTCAWKTKASSYHLKLTKKLDHVTFTSNKNKKFDWLFTCRVDPIWFVWHTYISHSLPHSSIELLITLHCTPDALSQRDTLMQEMFQVFLITWNDVWISQVNMYMYNDQWRVCFTYM